MSDSKKRIISGSVGAAVAVALLLGGQAALNVSTKDVVSEIIDTNEFSDVENVTVSDKGEALVLKTDKGKTFYAIYNNNVLSSGATKIVAGDGYLINEGRLIPYITDEDGTRYTLPSYSGDSSKKVEELEAEIARMKQEYDQANSDYENMRKTMDVEYQALKKSKEASDQARKQLEEKVSNLLDRMEKGEVSMNTTTNTKDVEKSESHSNKSSTDENFIAGASVNDINPFAAVEKGEVKTSKDRLYQKIPEEERKKFKKEIVDTANLNYKKEALATISDKIAPLGIQFPSHTKESKGEITVFTDPSCPYCRKLHNDLEKIRMKGYDVRYFPIPKDGMSSPITIQLGQVMCAPKEAQAEAINNVFDNNSYYDSNVSGRAIDSCISRVKSHLDTAIKLEATKTPFAFSNNGDVSEGYSNIDTFLENLGFEE